MSEKSVNFLKRKKKKSPLFLSINHGDIFLNVTQKMRFPYLGHEFWSLLNLLYDPVVGEGVILVVLLLLRDQF